MQAVVRTQYGAPEQLTCARLARPSPGDDQVLVRVRAAGVSIGDHHVITGKPYLVRLSPYGGVPRPKNRVPGMAFAGYVEAVGANVKTLAPGDEVFGEAPCGAFAEWLVVAEKLVAPKPNNLSFEQAAAVPWATAALQGLRDAGRLASGQHVLLNGASGGVGTWAVQIAKALGAEVTAVCSTRNVELVRSLGADEVVDYTTQDFTVGGARFDLMFDMVGNRSVSDCLHVLRPKGSYVSCAGAGGDWLGPLPSLAGLLLRSLVTSQRLTTFFATAAREDLLALKGLVEAGQARPVIERTYALSQVAEALRHVGEGHAQGQTVLRIPG